VAAFPGQRKYCHIWYDIVLWFSPFACYAFDWKLLYLLILLHVSLQFPFFENRKICAGYCILKCDAVLFGRYVPAFQRNLLLSSCFWTCPCMKWNIHLYLVPTCSKRICLLLPYASLYFFHSRRNNVWFTAQTYFLIKIRLLVIFVWCLPHYGLSHPYCISDWSSHAGEEVFHLI